MASKQRAVASNVSISLGMANVLVDIVPAAVSNKDKDSQFKMICPECTEPTSVSQKYVCAHDHGPYFPYEVTRRAQVIDGEMVEVSQDEINEVKGAPADDEERAPKTLSLDVVDADDFTAATLPGENIWRFRPNAKTTSMDGYVLIRHLVKAADTAGKVLVGELTIRETPRVVKLGVWRGQIIAHAVMRPDDIAEADPIPDTEPSEKLQALGAAVLEQLAVEFDPANFRNEIRERAKALAARKAENPGATILPITPTAKAAKADDLEAVLAGMLIAS